MRVAISPLTSAAADCSLVRSESIKEHESSLQIEVPMPEFKPSVPPAAQSTPTPGAHTCTLTFFVPAGPVLWLQTAAFPRLVAAPTIIMGKFSLKSWGAVLICFGSGLGFGVP
jgi:hypothetical protein